MQNIPIRSMIPHQETLSLFYHLGQHVLEATEEGGILIAEHASGKTLDQDETYHLFLVLAARFTSNDQQDDRSVKGREPCS